MFSLLYFYISILFVTTLLTSKTWAFAVRDTVSDISSTKGGVLVKNGKQSSCELGVIDSTAAFVAAPCLDFSGSSVNKNTKYEVYLDAGIDKTPVKYTVYSITVHPDYDANTNTNPIAVLQFNKGGSSSWSNSIAINRGSSWGDVVFARRGLADINAMEWSTPMTTLNNLDTTNSCGYNSHVFKANENSFFCSNATTNAPLSYLTNCAIPYGSVSVYISGKVYVAGLYAYTVLMGTNIECTLRFLQASSYILLADYIAFASKVLGRSISYYPNSGGISPQSDSGYSMSPPATPDNGVTFLDGDLYANQNDVVVDDSSSSTPASSAVSSTETSGDKPQSDSTRSVTGTEAQNGSNGSATNTAKEQNGDGDDEGYSTADRSDMNQDGYTGASSNRSASSKKNAIIGAVCGTLGGIILACLSLYFYKRWQRSHKNVYKDKDAQMYMQTMLVIDSNNAPSMPSTHSLVESGPTPSTQPPPTNHFNRDIFDDLDYDLPPLYEPNTRISTTAPR